MGSDYFQVLIVYQSKGNVEDGGRLLTWSMTTANWELFRSKCNENFSEQYISDDIVEFSSSITKIFMMAAKLAIPKISGHLKGFTHVLWCNKECKKAIKERYKAYK